MPAVSNECWELVSYSMGCVSVLIWICAQMPQIWKNWRKRNVAGLSQAFLITWIAGDTSNLLGCILTGQLGVQVVLASYFCLVDIILIAQFNLYKQPSDMYIVEGYDPFAEGGDSLQDNTNHVAKPRTGSMAERLYGKLGSIITAGSMIGRATAAPIDSVSAVGDTDYASMFGYSVAYFSMFMYLASRIPQIYHNFQRKSTTGVSKVLFFCAIMGNITYILSIILSPQSVGEGAHTKEFLMREMSYIIGSLGTVVFDCVILSQWLWYRRTPEHHRRSTAPLDRISRPYLGLPGPSSRDYCVTPAIRPSESLAGSPPSLSLLHSSDTPSNATTRLMSSPVYYGSTNGESALI